MGGGRLCNPTNYRTGIGSEQDYTTRDKSIHQMSLIRSNRWPDMSLGLVTGHFTSQVELLHRIKNNLGSPYSKITDPVHFRR